MTNKKETKIFKYTNPTSGDIFWYIDETHKYLYWKNEGKPFLEKDFIELPGTTTPLKLVNELSWDADGKMTDKSQIIQQWAIKMVTNEILEKCPHGKTGSALYSDEWIASVVTEAKKAPNKKFTGAGISGTEIHAQLERWIKYAIEQNGGQAEGLMGSVLLEALDINAPQTFNFIKWADKNKVKFLFSEEPIYSKEWMNCGTVDFICEIDGKILVGDIKTNGDKRRYEWNTKTNKYDYTKPVSDIHIPALWQCGAYGKMCTEEGARKLIDKFDGIVVVNIKKSGEFDEKLDVRYDYNVESLVTAYDLVLRLYKEFRNKYN
jgi:hypothetical protein